MEYNRETNISINEAVYRLESQVKKKILMLSKQALVI